MTLVPGSSDARKVKHVLNKGGENRSDPVSAARIAKAQTLAWLFDAKADFAILPALAASPMTWIPGCSFDSNVIGSIGHQPDRSARPASCASWPASCAGMTLATSALNVSPAVLTNRPFTSPAWTPPANGPGSHSIIPG